MKKTGVLSTVLLLLSTLPLSSCTKPAEEPVDPYEEYKLIYNGESKQKAGLINDESVHNRASYCYKHNDENGYNGWTLILKDGNAEQELVYENGKWSFGENYLTDQGVIFTQPGKYIGFKIKTKSTYVFSFGGTIQQFENESGVLADVVIYKNNLKVYPVGNLLTTTAQDESGHYIEGVSNCNTGDEFVFLVSGENVYFNPVIKKGPNLNDSLYNTHNEWTYYGDIHCYYHNDKLYLYHLWNNGNWFWNMQTTTDMFRYEDAGYDESFIQNHYMAYGKTPDVVDYSIYKSARDCTTFWDEEVQRYRSIGLGYLNTQIGSVSCDLFLRTSADELGFDWSNHAIPLRQFPTPRHGEPECSQLIKIGKRWYLCTGISAQSPHGVGTLSYWFGEEGQTIDEIDWLNLPTHKLDGEDICVPQIEKVRDKHYLFGWMPQNPVSSNWGGYKNLPREVYQNPDGTLSTKFDIMATKLLNKGKLFDLNETNTNGVNAVITNNNIEFLSEGRVDVIGQVGQTFSKFEVELKGAKTFNYIMKDGTTDYNIAIEERSDGNTYFKVHKNGTYTYTEFNFGPSPDKYTCKLVCHGSIIELCVNDKNVLSARTQFNGANYMYTPGFYADGAATISNISINRLAQLYDVYD